MAIVSVIRMDVEVGDLFLPGTLQCMRDLAVLILPCQVHICMLQGIYAFNLLRYLAIDIQSSISNAQHTPNKCNFRKENIQRRQHKQKVKKKSR